jgi:hypothetical protein
MIISSGVACADKCICDACATQAVKCLTDDKCRALVDCANKMMCTDMDGSAAQIACAMQRCAGEFADASGLPLLNASAFGTCVAGANCGAKCIPEGGTEGGGDAPKADAPADTTTTPDSADSTTTADSTTSDSTTEAGGD